MNRRDFFKTLGLGLAGFTILPGAGRVWKATRNTPALAFWTQTTRLERVVSPEYQRAFVEAFFYGKPVPPDLRVEWAELPEITVSGFTVPRQPIGC